MNIKFILNFREYHFIPYSISPLIFLSLLASSLIYGGCTDDSSNKGVSNEVPMTSDILGGTDGSNEDMEIVDMEVVDQEPDAEPLPLLEPEFVMNKIELLGSDEGFDLNGDGLPNNALALLFSDPLVGPALGGDPNEYIAKSIRKAKLLLLLDFINFNSFNNDDSVNIEIYLGDDYDGERSNNFDGTAFGVTCSSLTPEGFAESRFVDATISGGRLEGEGGAFRFLVSFSNTEVLLQGARIVGTFDPEGQRIINGMLGGAVTFEDLEEVVRNDPEIGPQFAQVMLTFLRAKLDADLDGDGVFDALSASFSFEAVPAVINIARRCEE